MLDNSLKTTTFAQDYTLFSSYFEIVVSQASHLIEFKGHFILGVLATEQDFITHIWRLLEFYYFIRYDLNIPDSYETITDPKSISEEHFDNLGERVSQIWLTGFLFRRFESFYAEVLDSLSQLHSSDNYVSQLSIQVKVMVGAQGSVFTTHFSSPYLL